MLGKAKGSAEGSRINQGFGIQHMKSCATRRYPERGLTCLEVEMKVLKSQECTAEQSTSITKEEINSLRLKIEELEAERSKLEEENRSLEMKLEKLTLQGDYDPSKTKVLHFSMNPASLAKQQRKEEQQQLQEECERLRELVRVLEGGGSIHGNLEGVGSFQSPQEIAELKKQVESAELKNQRLKEVFQTKIQEFRKVCYTLTGYQIDITTENQYRLTSIYAEHQGDCLLFKVGLHTPCCSCFSGSAVSSMTVYLFFFSDLTGISLPPAI
uniref:Mitotic arrest deficient 1 like 1 n=1 Tax=Cairina moschata TaxID=8855 RepID=A0A8C3C6T8_CAIMO